MSAEKVKPILDEEEKAAAVKTAAAARAAGSVPTQKKQ
jgi:hypothetical protein